ncbi:FAD-dependent oxidoreductase, partial [Vibrio parahaemolyticus]|nr:FAD-dependent oxidoreductase [Vibrio parahaemolyticus]
VIAGSVDEFKKDNGRLLDWYKTQMDKLGINIKLNTLVTKEMIEEMNADAVIVACGSHHIIPKVKGIDKANVYTASEVLLDNSKVGNKVAVIGGGLVGCETALSLAMAGKDVTVIEMLPELMASGLPV